MNFVLRKIFILAVLRKTKLQLVAGIMLMLSSKVLETICLNQIDLEKWMDFNFSKSQIQKMELSAILP